MALIKDGWWQDTWWPSRWWQEDYWPEYGVVSAPPIPVSGALATIRRRRKILLFKVKQFLEAESS